MPADPLNQRAICLGVTGGISAFKSAALASLLAQSGARVITVMTDAAVKLVAPVTFRALTNGPVYTSDWNAPDSPFPHITIADQAELLVIAPCTADMLAKLALGLADDLLSTTALAVTCPLLIAPAMNPRMWMHPATRANAATLASRNAFFIGPAEGRMACGDVGIGRMAEPDQILAEIRKRLPPKK
jgi:phosphopantothenoylcysteine decarboxylase / phosphopantothenate---cysteine ligase